MGYIIVGSEDGISIIDPHSGSWAERTAGWPRSLSTSTTPALTNNDVVAVAAGFSDAPTLDPRTGGYMPTFAVNYGTGADIGSVLKDDGNVWDKSGTVGNTGAYIKSSGLVGFANNTGNDQVTEVGPISIITADDPTGKAFLTTDSAGYGFGAGTALTVGSDGTVFSASASGLSQAKFTNYNGAFAERPVTALINRTYNSGALSYDIRGAWLANSATADRSYKGNTLTANGSITEAAVETSAELMGYSGFSTSNYLERAYDADFQFGTGDFSVSLWFKSSGTSAIETLIHRGTTGDNYGFRIALSIAGGISFYNRSNTGVLIQSASGFDDNAWHHVVAYRKAATIYLFVDGRSEGTPTASTVDVDSGSALLRIGRLNSGSYPATTSTISLVRVSATAPSATQIRQMYDAEKPMFVASAECLLQSSSTDAVLDVDVDPLTGKVLVTQTDAITIFDGLAVDSKPTVNAGASEKGKLWGDLRSEQNDTNAYVTAPAVDQRQVNEMVRGLASDLPAGVDMSKAKAWVIFNGTGTVAIQASYNIKSITDNGTGDWYVNFAVPFKGGEIDYLGLPRTKYAVTGLSKANTSYDENLFISETYTNRARFYNVDGSNTFRDSEYICLSFFGELENE